MKTLPPLHQLGIMTYAWFRELPHDLQEKLKGSARRRTLADAQRLFSRGEESNGIYGVVSGGVRLSGISFDGRETTLDFYGPGVWFGEVSALSGLPRGHDVEATGPTIILHLAQAELETLLTSSPVLSRAFLRLEGLRLHAMLAGLEFYSIQSYEKRLASRLLMLVATFGRPQEKGVLIDLHLPQETLAQLVGSTRQRINQIFQDWEKLGVIKQDYGRVVLLDQKWFERLATT